MSIQDVNTIANRLSLREPQRDSLKILDRVLEISNHKGRRYKADFGNNPKRVPVGEGF